MAFPTKQGRPEQEEERDYLAGVFALDERPKTSTT